MQQDIYKKHGYENRGEYLLYLSCEYNCPLGIVYHFADMLGEDEDFDGLVSALEDL